MTGVIREACVFLYLFIYVEQKSSEGIVAPLDEMLVLALFAWKSVGACLNLGLSQAKASPRCPQQSLQISAM